MTLPGTIPENLLSREWGPVAGTVSEIIPTTGLMLDGGFVNSAAKVPLTKDGDLDGTCKRCKRALTNHK